MTCYWCGAETEHGSQSQCIYALKAELVKLHEDFRAETERVGCKLSMSAAFILANTRAEKAEARVAELAREISLWEELADEWSKEKVAYWRIRDAKKEASNDTL
jgi:hypothetical protein